ncbi:hypothetical protein BD626DRAFT_491147 [Schizophyllum amplum]|uniref:Enoyl reductase (ER) domain-containing protein n=1 Tax=Schizophyllum amplum TaxID=97359 RepID=A0A550CHE1_9AGAR|nr:hypothetical protein BD626DRAFT_491147 [Auriculariopsis ampla]
MPASKCIVLAERPTKDIDPARTFRQETREVGDPGEGEVLVKVMWLSLDPAMRGWLNDKRSYLPPVQIGETMRSGGLGVVAKAGEGVKLAVGDAVQCTPGWTEYAVLKAASCTKIILPPGTQVLDYLNTLGSPGMTAYFGLKDVGKLKAGEKLLVSGAAGAVGSLVCQLGVSMGAQVYAIAGQQEKCEWLEKELGVVKGLNYKAPDFRQQLKSIGYIDVYFDNVGGEILDMVLLQLNMHARIPFCGSISGYNGKPRPLQNYPNIIAMRATLQGFIVFDYAKQYEAARKELAEGLSSGAIKRKFHIVEGLEKCPEAVTMLFSGGNTGKLVVKVADVDETQARL